MKELIIHAERVSYEVTKETKLAEKIGENEKRGEMENALWVRVSMEKGDENNIESLVRKAVSDIEEVSEQVKTKNVMLYPYAHLLMGSKPAPADAAIKILDEMARELGSRGFNVVKAPFGWYKKFSVSCKGHPLSELSRVFEGEDSETGGAAGIGELGIEKSKLAAIETAAHLIYESERQILNKEFISVSKEEGGFGTVLWRGMKDISDEDIKKAIENANQLAAKGEPVRVEFMSREDAFKKCGDFFKSAVPQNAESIRVVSIGNLPPEPCKNKHIPDINLIESIKLEKIERDDENAKVWFSLELSPKMEANGEVSESLKQESRLKSQFYIMGPDGNLHDIGNFDFSGHENLKKFATYETKKTRAYDKEPPHIKVMKEQELVDYEPGTDAGNFRWYPKGRLLKKLLERSVTDFCIDYGAMEVETPLMYDYEHPSLKKYLNRFPARQYVVISENKEFFLRFAACFGQFLMSHDMVVSYKQLPLRMFELTRYSFRREQTGELAGLKRLRGFTMPDMHGVLADMNQAKAEFESQLDAGMEWLGFVKLLDGCEVGFRILREFYEENKEWYASLVRKIGKPILVELYDERYAYFVTKFEFNFVDAMDKASALTTVQIDVENSETYDLSFVDERGEKKRPLLTHASISGSVERVVYALLEKEAMRMEKGEKALLPLWLCPTQVRIIPISEKHLEFAQEALSQIGEGVRADLDDTPESLGKKIRNAQKEWVPYVAVIGDTEVESGKVSVNVRETGEKVEMGALELASIVKEKTQGMPFEKLSLPVLLSKRPIFRG
jgi:threonyl-tRNA synthetase